MSIDWIQALRGLACLGVVLTHARYFMFNTPQWASADQLLVSGAAGVDLFFVISGFIMAYTTRLSSRDDVLPFLLRRIVRIWPPLLVMTLIWVFTLAGGAAVFKDRATLGVFLRTVFFLPVNPNKPPYFDMLLPVAWTLVFEMYFYAMFAVSMLFGKWRWIALNAWVAASVLVYPLSLRGLGMDPQLNLELSPSYLNIITSPLVLEFLFGVWAAFLYLNSWKIKSARLCWHLLIFVGVTAAWLCYNRILPIHGPGGWGVAAASLVMTLAIVSKTIHISAPRAIVWLGSISYSLYLTHTCIQQLLVRYLERHGVETHTWNFIWYSTILCCLLAWPYYEVVETRLTTFARRVLNIEGSNRNLRSCFAAVAALFRAPPDTVVQHQDRKRLLDRP
jgi:exopolysaccharide production protein ExoZ